MLSSHWNYLNPGQGHCWAFFKGESTFFLLNLADMAIGRTPAACAGKPDA